MLNKSIFRKLNIITLGSVLVLILVGSIVRSLGAGMGCPDWPKCFGEYIPPSSLSELPIDYKDIFKQQRITKNDRVASIFASIGFDDLSYKLINAPNVAVEKDFDITKAWIEYINRLVGVIVGLLVFANMIFSFSYLRNKIIIPILGVLIFVLTGFQGWIGSLVVSTNLLHGFITFHLLVAFLILALLIYQFVITRYDTKISNRRLFLLSLSMLIVFVPQILLGTGVRSIIDDFIFFDVVRAHWVNGLNSVFIYHRSYSWLILILSITFLLFTWKDSQFISIKQSGVFLVVLIMSAMIAGLGMVKYQFPFWLQPLHMFLATGIFSILIFLNLRISFN